MENNLINKNIKQWILKELEKQHISKYTAIQNLTLPLTLKNQNVIGISPTGTGKTLCFLIPILNKISLNENIQAIIIAPTRELARQIHSNIQLFKTNEIKIKSWQNMVLFFYWQKNLCLIKLFRGKKRWKTLQTC